MKVILACDHAGYELKEDIKKFLDDEGYEVEDVGAHKYDSEDDYPDLIIPAAKRVSQDPDNNMGIIIGGSGQGEAIAANKVPNIRAVVFYGPRQAVEAVDISGKKSEDPFEIIKLTREHNNANMLSFGVRFVDKDTAKKAVKLWLETPYGNGERHERRIKKINDYENNRR